MWDKEASSLWEVDTYHHLPRLQRWQNKEASGIWSGETETPHVFKDSKEKRYTDHRQAEAVFMSSANSSRNSCSTQSPGDNGQLVG